MQNRLFLGLDCSTQSLSAILIDDEHKKIVYETSINFDEELPHYKTVNGCLQGFDFQSKYSPPLMWVEALDMLFERMKNAGVPLSHVVAVSGSGQQHGSVYLNDYGVSSLSSLDLSKSLKENLETAFSRPVSPIWMDSSTTTECQEIQNALGGLISAVEATGSAVFERFTGPQIRKFYKNEPENYRKTEKILLVSSFMASLLSGKVAPIDFCDGSGMNLMDIRQKTWHTASLNATAPMLDQKLPSLAAPWTIVGTVSPYFVHHYGFNKEALSVVWSGDNPNSLIGLGISDTNTVAISLGTSFTYFGHMQDCRIDKTGKGHVFASPTGNYMSLNCFKNGALALEKIRNQFSLDWNGFNQCLRDSPPGNNEKMILPYFEPEIIPKEPSGLKRYNLDACDAAGNCRAVVEAQMMSMRHHAEWMRLKASQIYATGGASVNLSILQVMADVFDCPVKRIAVSKSASLGAALRAIHAYSIGRGKQTSWEEIITDYITANAEAVILPNKANVKVYDKLIKKYALL